LQRIPSITDCRRRSDIPLRLKCHQRDHGLMKKEELSSAFVKYVMPLASEEEIEEATRNWFRFLETIREIAEARHKRDIDSQMQ
jgi:hypothetical protein